MNFLLLLALSTTALQASLPPEVAAFIADRDACDHFRGEAAEGDAPYQVERRIFITESVEIFCSGTDRRLAALKRRYVGNPAVTSALSDYEPVIEGPECGP